MSNFTRKSLKHLSHFSPVQICYVLLKHINYGSPYFHVTYSFSVKWVAEDILVLFFQKFHFVGTREIVKWIGCLPCMWLFGFNPGTPSGTPSLPGVPEHCRLWPKKQMKSKVSFCGMEYGFILCVHVSMWLSP